MNYTEELIDHLKHFEGFVGHPYRCPAGYLTIGYGHRIDKDQPNITEEEATILLTKDIARFTLGAVRLSPNLKLVGGRRLNAIIDFCFNAGLNAYAGSTLRLKVNTGEWEDAAAQMRRWVYITDPKTKQKHKSAWQIKRREVTARWLEGK